MRRRQGLVTVIDGALTAPRRPRLQKLFSSFPDGWPGLGLLLERLTLALTAAVRATCLLMACHLPAWQFWSSELLALVLCGAIFVGMFTPIASAAVAAGSLIVFAVQVAKGVSADAELLAFLPQAGLSTALLMLGPGAYSIDARLFGRREIIIPETRRRQR